MGAQVKNETRKPVTMTAADYRRKVIRMVAEVEDVKSLEFIYSFTYPFYRDDSSDPKAGNDLFSRTCWMLTLIGNQKYLKFIYGFVRRLFLKPDSGVFTVKGGEQE